jgi:hypothetical protein
MSTLLDKAKKKATSVRSQIPLNKDMLELVIAVLNQDISYRNAMLAANEEYKISIANTGSFCNYIPAALKWGIENNHIEIKFKE